MKGRAIVHERREVSHTEAKQGDSTWRKVLRSDARDSEA